MTQDILTGAALHPFRIDVPEDELLDLRRRIAETRWPSKELVEDRSQADDGQRGRGLFRPG